MGERLLHSRADKAANKRPSRAQALQSARKLEFVVLESEALQSHAAAV